MTFSCYDSQTSETIPDFFTSNQIITDTSNLATVTQSTDYLLESADVECKMSR